MHAFRLDHSMNLSLFHYFSALLFVSVYYWQGLYQASLAIAVASLAELCYLLASKTPCSDLEKANLVLVSAFGGLSWWFQSASYIQWKVSIVHALFALGVIVYRGYYKQSAFASIFASQGLTLPERVSKTLDYGFIFFFSSIALVNALVMQHLSVESWVWFKGSLVFVNLLFMCTVAIYIWPHCNPSVLDQAKTPLSKS